MKFEIYKDKAGKWRWRVKASNGRIVSCSGESFASKFNATRAWKSFAKKLFYQLRDTPKDYFAILLGRK